jgi:hypothetical protein
MLLYFITYCQFITIIKTNSWKISISISIYIPTIQHLLSEISYDYDNWSNPFGLNHIQKHRKNIHRLIDVEG